MTEDKWVVITEWETRTYRASYLVKVGPNEINIGGATMVIEQDEIGQRKFLRQEYVETWDSGEYSQHDIEGFIKEFPEEDIKTRIETYIREAELDEQKN